MKTKFSKSVGIALVALLGGSCFSVSAATYQLRVSAPGVKTPFSSQAPSIGPLVLSDVPYGTGTFRLSAPQSTSTGAFTFGSSNPAVATVAGDMLTVVGVGSTVISATQATTTTAMAGQVTATFSVVPAAPTFGALALPSKMMGDAAFPLTAPTSNSAGAITYVSSNTAVAQISGNMLTIVSAGTATITANQAAQGNYLASSVSALFTATAALPPGYVVSGGLTWSPADTTQRTYPQAVTYCSTTSLNGQTGWRLPNSVELKTIWDRKAASGYTWNRYWYWSSTQSTVGQRDIIDNADGNIKQNPDTGATNYVACVK